MSFEKMENYDQHNEVSTSYNNNDLKHNFNETKNDFFIPYEVEIEKYKTEFVDSKSNYRVKTEDSPGQHNIATPFSVKDILNINQTPNYNCERNDLWKLHDRERRNYEYYDVYTHQNQAYCPEYISQPYHNIPVHTNVDTYWNQEIIHDHKIDEYYNYAPYCPNLYHQNYDQYIEPPMHPVVDISKKDITDVDVVHPMTPTLVHDRNNQKNEDSEVTTYQSTETFEKHSPLSRKNTSKSSFHEPII